MRRLCFDARVRLQAGAGTSEMRFGPEGFKVVDPNEATGAYVDLGTGSQSLTFEIRAKSGAAPIQNGCHLRIFLRPLTDITDSNTGFCKLPFTKYHPPCATNSAGIPSNTASGTVW